jgi:hypothetical protein
VTGCVGNGARNVAIEISNIYSRINLGYGVTATKKINCILKKIKLGTGFAGVPSNSTNVLVQISDCYITGSVYYLGSSNLSFLKNNAFYITSTGSTASLSQGYVEDNLYVFAALVPLNINSCRSLKNNVITSLYGTGGIYNVNFATAYTVPFATMENCEFVACAVMEISSNSPALTNNRFKNCRFIRSVANCLRNGDSTQGTVTKKVFFDDCYFSGATSNFYDTANNRGTDMIFRNCTFRADATYPTGALMTTISGVNVPPFTARFDNCTLDNPHGTSLIIAVNTNSGGDHTIILNNCPNNWIHLFTPGAQLFGLMRFLIQDKNGVDGVNEMYYNVTKVESDAVIKNSDISSLRVTPSSTTEKSIVEIGQVAVKAEEITFNVDVRKSAVGDGVAYNGAEPRLFVKQNLRMGIAEDTLLSTTAGAAGVWVTLTSTLTPTRSGVLEFYVDCDGTAGFINLDEAKVMGDGAFIISDNNNYLIRD